MSAPTDTNAPDSGTSPPCEVCGLPFANATAEDADTGDVYGVHGECARPTTSTPEHEETYEYGDLQCPWCGYMQEAWELKLGDGEKTEHDCDKCERPIEVECSITVAYTCKPLVDEQRTREATP